MQQALMCFLLAGRTAGDTVEVFEQEREENESPNATRKKRKGEREASIVHSYMYG